MARNMTWLPKSVVCLRYYDRSRFRSDLFAALVLALELFPACIAIAIASGLAPVYGVSCAAIAGLVASALGDSKIRISGPNIVLLAAASGIVMRQGTLGLSLSTLLAGVLLAFFGAIGLGAAIQVLPRPVAVGFSTGIAILVMTKQLPDLLGGRPQLSAEGAGWRTLTGLPHGTQVEPRAILLGLASLTLIVAGRRMFKRIPVGLAVMALGALLVKFGLFPVRTVGTFGLTPFSLHLMTALRPDLLDGVLSQAFAIAVLVAIESLQAIRVASGHAGEHVSSAGELVLQGGVNVATAFVGGLPACGNSSYTSENALLGAQTPLAGILQSFLLVGFLFLFLPLSRYIPLTLISAFIFSSVWSMTHWRELPQILKLGRTEVATWIAISFLTIVDLTVAVAVGMIATMFLHIRKHKTTSLGGISDRAADASGLRWLKESKGSRFETSGPNEPRDIDP